MFSQEFLKGCYVIFGTLLVVTLPFVVLFVGVRVLMRQKKKRGGPIDE